MAKRTVRWSVSSFGIRIATIGRVQIFVGSYGHTDWTWSVCTPAMLGAWHPRKRYMTEGAAKRAATAFARKLAGSSRP